MDERVRELLNEYYKLFPNEQLFPEWFDIPNREKIEMLNEAIKDKKDLSQTRIFDKYQEKVIEIIGKIKYVGKSFGVEGLTDNKVYDVIGVEYPFFRIIDDSKEDYLYSIIKPSSLDDHSLCGKWELIEDNKGLLKDYFNINKALIKAHELLNDKSLCILKYAETTDYFLFEYGTKDKKPIFDDTLIKVDKSNFVASYYKIVGHLDEINKLVFYDII